MEEYKKQIKEIGLTFKKVAELLGVSNALLSLYLSSDRTMSFEKEDKLKKIIKAYQGVV